MTNERPLEVMQLTPYLRSQFIGRLPEATKGSPESRESNFLSRALAAYAIHKLAGCNLDDAAAAVVDGGGDGGIDAIYFAEATSRLWVVQSKFHRSGQGVPDLGGVLKFKNGLEQLLRGNFHIFADNHAWQALLPQLSTIFNNAALQVRAVLVYSGLHVVTDDKRQTFESLRQQVAGHDPGYFQIQFCNLTTVHDWMTGADEDPGVPEVELTVHQPGWVKKPFETIYGLVSFADLARLAERYGKRLIAANIRAYQGTTAVNTEIAATLREEPAHFFYLNNGLTAYCTRLEVHNLDRADSEKKRLRAFGLSIVNGAQTLGTIARCWAEAPDALPEGYVLLRIISLERCEDDRVFAERITRSTNFQNQIGPRDFVALDEQQERIAVHLAQSGVHYHYKAAADTPLPDETNFTLDEATTACASLFSAQDCDLCARILADRPSLWSFETVYPDDSLYRSRYATIFRDDFSARGVWRAVQTQRVVLASLADGAATFDEEFVAHACWLILHLIFARLAPQHGEGLTLSAEEQTRIVMASHDYAACLWDACVASGLVVADAMGGWATPRPWSEIFGSAPECQALRRAVFTA